MTPAHGTLVRVGLLIGAAALVRGVPVGTGPGGSVLGLPLGGLVGPALLAAALPRLPEVP